MNFSKLTALMLILATSFMLTACGVKPGSVEPPPGQESSQFPHTYPAPDETR